MSYLVGFMLSVPLCSPVMVSFRKRTKGQALLQQLRYEVGYVVCQVTAVGFEPTPLRTGAWSQRLRPVGQTVMCTRAVVRSCGLELPECRRFDCRVRRVMDLIDMS